MPTSDLTGRALAEAAQVAMGLPREPMTGWRASDGSMRIGILWLPDQSADADYLCLEWAREHWGDKSEPMVMRWRKFAGALGAAWDYVPGDYARALVAAAGEGER